MKTRIAWNIDILLLLQQLVLECSTFFPYSTGACFLSASLDKAAAIFGRRMASALLRSRVLPVFTGSPWPLLQGLQYHNPSGTCESAGRMQAVCTLYGHREVLSPQSTNELGSFPFLQTLRRQKSELEEVASTILGSRTQQKMSSSGWESGSGWDSGGPAKVCPPFGRANICSVK